MRYDGLDDRSLAVDGVQRSVSVGHLLVFFLKMMSLKTSCSKYSLNDNIALICLILVAGFQSAMLLRVLYSSNLHSNRNIYMLASLVALRKP